MKKLLTPIWLLICLLFGCSSPWKQSIPDSEIMYQLAYSPLEIGFVDANGVGPVIIKAGSYFRKPVSSHDGSLLYGLADGTVALTFGYPAYWSKNGDFKMCRNWENYWQIEPFGNTNNPKEVFINNARTISLVDLERCVEIEKVVDYSENEDIDINGISGLSYFSARRELLYATETLDATFKPTYQLMMMNIETGKLIKLGDGMINPVWSPDGSRIAYLHLDGIYVMMADGTQSTQVVKRFFGDHENINKEIAPIPRWSPDGRWLIYHHCMDDSCAVFKVDITNGQEEKIIDNGAYPSWRSQK